MRTILVLICILFLSVTFFGQDSAIYRFSIDSHSVNLKLKKGKQQYDLIVNVSDSTSSDSSTSKLTKWNKESFENEIVLLLWRQKIKQLHGLSDSINKAFEHFNFFVEKNNVEELQKKNDALQKEVDQYKNLFTKNTDDSVQFIKEYQLGNEIYTLEITSLKESKDITKVRTCLFPKETKKCDSAFVPIHVERGAFGIALLRIIDSISPLAIKVDPEKRILFATTAYNDWQEKIEKKLRDAKFEKERNAQREFIDSTFKSIAGIVDSLTKFRDTAIVEINMKSRLPLYQLKEGYVVGDRKILLNRDKSKKTPYFITIKKGIFRIEHGYITSISLEPNDTIINIGIDSIHIDKTLLYNFFIDIRSAIESKTLMDHYFPIFKMRRKLNFYNYDHKAKINTKITNGTNPYKDQFYINLADFIKYSINIDNTSDVLVHVRNRNISFNGDTSKPVTLREKDFSSFAQINVYTDLIGLSEDKPNGLLQFEGKFETDIFRTPVNWHKQYTSARWFIFSNAQANFSLTKLEKKLRFLDIRKSNVIRNAGDTVFSTGFVNNIDLVQYSSLNIGLNVKLIELASDYFRSYLFAGAAVVRTPLRDTSLIVDQTGASFLKETESVSNTIRFNYGINFQFKSTSNLGLETGLQFIHLKLNSTDVRNAYEKYDETIDSVLVREASFGKNVIINPYLNIYYYLDQERSKRIFIRASYFREIRTRKNDFTWFQFGYSTDLKGFFRIFSKSEKKEQQIPE